MSNVINLDDYRPHSTCEMQCGCGKIWQAVYPSHCTDLQCPQCGIMVKIEQQDTNGKE